MQVDQSMASELSYIIRYGASIIIHFKLSSFIHHHQHASQHAVRVVLKLDEY